MNDGYSSNPDIGTEFQPLAIPLTGIDVSRGPMRTLARVIGIAQETSGTVRLVCPQSGAEHTLDGSILDLIQWIAEKGVASALVQIDAPPEEEAGVRRRFEELFGA